MKILLLVNETHAAGGSGRNATNLSTALREGGNEVFIIGYQYDFLSFLKKARAIAKISDIVYAVDINPIGFAGYLATRFTRVKLVIAGKYLTNNT